MVEEHEVKPRKGLRLVELLVSKLVLWYDLLDMLMVVWVDVELLVVLK